MRIHQIEKCLSSQVLSVLDPRDKESILPSTAGAYQHTSRYGYGVCNGRGRKSKTEIPVGCGLVVPCAACAAFGLTLRGNTGERLAML